MNGIRILIGLLVVGSVVAVQPSAAMRSSTATAAVDSAPPETADEYLSTFQSMEGVPAFDRYTQFETIRSLAVSKLQVAEFDDATEREMATTLRLLRSFREAYQAAANGSTAASLEAANRSLTAVASLKAQGLTYAPLAEIAVERFYENRGDEFLQAAANASRTPEQIEQLELASVAFRRASASQKFSQVSLRFERVRSEYQRDVETMNASASAAASFLSACSSCSDVGGAISANGLQTFEFYLEAGPKLAGLREAESLADKHGLEARGSTYATRRQAVSSARGTLAVASAGLLLGYGVVVALVAMLVGHRIVTWSETVRASQVGEIVMLEEVNDA